jgi:hypothetical protein
MRGQALIDLLARLALNGNQAARLCGIDPRGMRRAIADEQDLHPAAARLLAVCQGRPDVLEQLRTMKGSQE